LLSSVLSFKFLWSQGVKPSKTQRRMLPQYGENYIMQRNVYQWVERFQSSRTNIIDEDHLGHRPFHEQQTVLNELMLWFKGTGNYCYWRRWQVGHHLWIFTVHHPWGPQASQNFYKMGAKAANRHTQTGMQYLHQYHEEGEAFLQWIVTGDET